MSVFESLEGLHTRVFPQDFRPSCGPAAAINTVTLVILVLRAFLVQDLLCVSEFLL